jgi:hypothetical protein
MASNFWVLLDAGRGICAPCVDSDRAQKDRCGIFFTLCGRCDLEERCRAWLSVSADDATTSSAAATPEIPSDVLQAINCGH